MDVRSILKIKGSNVVSVEENTPIIDVAAVLGQKQIGAVLVTNRGGEVVGLISERDIVRALAQVGGAVLDQPAHELMTRDLHTCDLDTSIAELMEIMTERRIRHLPVLENGQLSGIVSIGDIVKHRIAETELEARALREYIATG